MSKEATVSTTKGGTLTLKEDDLDGLQVRGAVIVPSDGEQYDQARVIWNSMIDRKPGMIVECLGTADVVSCVKFAQKHSVQITVRGAGHNIAGKSIQDGAMLIDLSKWRSLHVDPIKQVANISPGATLGDIDHETGVFGLALPVGINSTTGISGLTLGGGFGWLCRKYGMTLDSLLSADVVLANGKIVHCDENTEADLFWGLRGGGGNFGIVTNFEFQLYPVGPVTAGPIVFPLDEAKHVLQGLNSLYPNMPEELCPWGVFRQCPPFPFIAEEHHFKPVFIIAVCWIGAPEDAKAEIDKIRALGSPLLGDGVGEMPLAAWQQAFDPLLTPGFRNYWKTNNFVDLNDGMIDALCSAGESLVNFGTEVFIAAVGGAATRVPSDKTAYAHRNANFIVNCHTRWESPGEDDVNKTFARDLFKDLLPFSDGTSYSNFVSAGDEKPEEEYGPALAKLAKVKAEYDPDNFFSVNYNVVPSK